VHKRLHQAGRSHAFAASGLHSAQPVIEPSCRAGYLAGICPNIFDRIESKAMVERERFSVPQEIEEILDRLPSKVTLHVPDQVLSHWFPPGPADGGMGETTLARIQSYAKSCGCYFAYDGSLREGIFYRQVPDDD
jgi:hypothetical protein